MRFRCDRASPCSLGMLNLQNKRLLHLGPPELHLALSNFLDDLDDAEHLPHICKPFLTLSLFAIYDSLRRDYNKIYVVITSRSI